jgi:hypothetical protein
LLFPLFLAGHIGYLSAAQYSLMKPPFTSLSVFFRRTKPTIFESITEPVKEFKFASKRIEVFHGGAY